MLNSLCPYKNTADFLINPPCCCVSENTSNRISHCKDHPQLACQHPKRTLWLHPQCLHHTVLWHPFPYRYLKQTVDHKCSEYSYRCQYRFILQIPLVVQIPPDIRQSRFLPVEDPGLHCFCRIDAVSVFQPFQQLPVCRNFLFGNSKCICKCAHLSVNIFGLIKFHIQECSVCSIVQRRVYKYLHPLRKSRRLLWHNSAQRKCFSIQCKCRADLTRNIQIPKCKFIQRRFSFLFRIPALFHCSSHHGKIAFFCVIQLDLIRLLCHFAHRQHTGFFHAVTLLFFSRLIRFLKLLKPVCVTAHRIVPVSGFCAGIFSCCMISALLKWTDSGKQSTGQNNPQKQSHRLFSIIFQIGPCKTYDLLHYSSPPSP